jgi:glycogen debranching enzyme
MGTSRSNAAKSTCTGRGVLWEGSCVERIRVTNFRLNRIDVPLAIRFDADFADVFEVRGTQRAKRDNGSPTRTATTT